MGINNMQISVFALKKAATEDRAGFSNWIPENGVYQNRFGKQMLRLCFLQNDY